MYLRSVHSEKEESELQSLVRDHPLGILTTAIASTDFPLLQQTHIPWMLDDAHGSSRVGLLRGHLARANPQAKQLLAEWQTAVEQGTAKEQWTLPAGQVTVLFTHATQSYVSPRFYTQTKPASGKVVPTWNYAAVEVRGTLRLDDSTGFLHKQINDLTRQNEPRSLSDSHDSVSKPGKEHPGWNVSDAPKEYIAMLSKAIVGVVIEIESMVGKFKMSQESPRGDREGVIAGFEAYGTPEDQRMADLVRERCKGKAM